MTSQFRDRLWELERIVDVLARRHPQYYKVQNFIAECRRKARSKKFDAHYAECRRWQHVVLTIRALPIEQVEWLVSMAKQLNANQPPPT